LRRGTGRRSLTPTNSSNSLSPSSPSDNSSTSTSASPSSSVVVGDSSHGEILTSEDWSLLMQHSSLVAYPKGNVIVKEGESAARIYQIAKVLTIHWLHCCYCYCYCCCNVFSTNRNLLNIRDVAK
jgi:hypothetical protein